MPFNPLVKLMALDKPDQTVAWEALNQRTDFISGVASDERLSCYKKMISNEQAKSSPIKIQTGTLSPSLRANRNKKVPNLSRPSVFWSNWF